MRHLPIGLLVLLGGLGGGLAYLSHQAPLAPAASAPWLRADALSAFCLLLLATQGLVSLTLPTVPSAQPWREVGAAFLFGLATLTGHLALAALLLLAGGLTLNGRRRPSVELTAILSTVCGLILIGLPGGAWDFTAAGTGVGLNNLSLALILLGASLAPGADALLHARPPITNPLATIATLYALLRLFSLGPWAPGWLLAAQIIGVATALRAAWLAVGRPPAQLAAWNGLHLMGLAIGGAGLGSSAGICLAGYAMLVWPVLRLGLSRPGEPHQALWTLAGITPLTAPFTLTWLAVAAAMAGELSLLALGLGSAALLLALAVGRLATGHVALSIENGSRKRTLTAATLSVAGGPGTPLLLNGLLIPVANQLYAGLTPYGEISAEPWIGLIAFDSTRQPVATLPLLVLAGVMLILAALSRLLRRPWRSRRHG